jgi:hypothetical protein
MSDQNANAELAPALELIFNGLFFLCFNNEGELAEEDPAGECCVGFLTTAPQHLITITGRRVGVIKPDFAFTLSHVAARRMQIGLDVPGVVPPSVTRKGHDSPIDRTTPTEVTGEYFKWIIDLENSEMHDRKLPLIPYVLKPVLKVNIGEFYTKELSKVKYFRTKVDEPDKDFGSVAAVTGVRIAALPQGKAFLKFEDALSFPLAAPEGQTYEVTFTNLCPQCEEKNLGNLHLSDFPLHYHAFDVKALERYDFDYPDPSPAFPPAVCYAATGSRTTDI